MATDPIRIAFPLGIGDCHWGCQKLAGIRALHPGRPVHAFVNESANHRTVGYLEIVEHVDAAFTSKEAPFDINTEMPPSYKSPKWRQLRGVRGWNGFDYLLVANGHVEDGTAIKHYLPELVTEYTYGLRIKPEDHAAVDALAPRVGPLGHVVLYPSGRGPNAGFHGHWWSPGDWVDVIKRLNGQGVAPIIMGANTPDDRGYADDVTRAGEGAGIEFLDLVGRTSIPQACSLIQRAGVWCGLNSGLGIVSAMLSTPTVMMWSDKRFKTPGQHPGFVPAMQRCWLSGEQLKTYRTVSYGHPSTTPALVVGQLLEVRR